MLRNERWLRQHDFLREPIQVHLERRDGLMIELQDARSGELSLISSLVFLSTAERGHQPVFLIDEPEQPSPELAARVCRTCNNLHILQADPCGHRDLCASCRYRRLGVVQGRRWVFQMVNGWPLRIPLVDSTPTSIEEVLWRAFDVVTPAISP